MTQLLVIREYIKNFYTKYEEFIVPLLKFVLGLILFLTINGRMGYMAKIDHVAIALVAALLCSFLPLGVMVFLSAMFLLLHTYALSAECVVVLLLAYIIVLVIYLRFAPKAHLLLLLTPLLFVWKIPYAAPLAAGLFGTPGAAAAVAGGVVVYYVLAYITGNAQAFGGGESDTMLQRFSEVSGESTASLLKAAGEIRATGAMLENNRQRIGEQLRVDLTDTLDAFRDYMAEFTKRVDYLAKNIADSLGQLPQAVGETADAFLDQVDRLGATLEEANAAINDAVDRLYPPQAEERQ